MRNQEQWAHVLANHGDMSAEIALPSELDYEVAGQIIRERDMAVYSAIISDPHAYVSWFRRFMWFGLYTLIVAAIAVGLILTHARSAQ